jgi:hypothetical protein
MTPKKRAILNDVLSRKPDKPLYHYTTQTGLIGIIKGREIWATHTQYLNDRREFLHAVDLVREEIKRLLDQEALDGSSQPVREQVLLRMQQAVSTSPETINVCVCSFSEESDSLSQWRAYGGSSGFAVGFAGASLTSATEKKEWFLAPCIYDPSEQRALIRALVEEVLEENLGGALVEDEEEDRVLKSLGGNLVAYLNRYAPILKDQSFKEEREWRIISRPIFCQRLDYREGRSLIVPYYRLPLWQNDQRIHLHEVVVGPTRDAKRSRSSVASLIVSRDVLLQGSDGAIHVRISEVPYRDW